MHALHFDAFTRFVTERSTRRGVLHALAGGGLAALVGWPAGVSNVAAKNQGGKKRKKKKTTSPSVTCTPTCRRKQCGEDGCGGSCGSCAAGQHCISGTCCTPEPPAVTCAGRCGTAISVKTCRQPVACSCPRGQQCLANGSCSTLCTLTADCPNCFSCRASTEGAKYCLAGTFCSSQTCTSTAECPVGEYCQVTDCGPNGTPENRCEQLCNG